MSSPLSEREPKAAEMILTKVVESQRERKPCWWKTTPEIQIYIRKYGVLLLSGTKYCDLKVL